MESKIDWSKAPEGYPLWITDPDGIIMPGWHKEIEGKYVDMRGGFWNKSDGGFTVHKRPTTPSWSGEGLPPVGVVCELRCLPVGAWGKAEIKYISETQCVWLWIRDDGGYQVELAEVPDAARMAFRPIRTPEQVAADERESAIKEMTANYAKNSDTLAGWAAYVYDTLGYRKEQK